MSTIPEELRAAATALRAAPDEPIEVNAVTGLWLHVLAVARAITTKTSKEPTDD